MREKLEKLFWYAVGLVTVAAAYVCGGVMWLVSPRWRDLWLVSERGTDALADTVNHLDPDRFEVSL